MTSGIGTIGKITGCLVCCLILQAVLSVVCLAEPEETAGAEQVAPAPQAFKSPYGSHLSPILKKIEASEDQTVKITEIVRAYKPKIEPLRLEYKQKSQDFLDCLVEGRGDSEVMINQGELNDLYSEIISQYGSMRLEIRRLLNPEQVKKFEKYRRQQGWSAR